jgi:RNA polymerase sigma-70 factor (ECF subfamily)
MIRDNVAKLTVSPSSIKEGLAHDDDSDPSDDGSAEHAVTRGDYREALARCAREHASGIGRLCMALTGSQAEADELVQEVLLLAHHSFASFRGDGTLRAWLFGIARRVCARHLEKRNRQARLRLVYMESPQKGRSTTGDIAGADEIASAREQAERARRALADLKPTEREALLLRYGSDLAFREVAVACGIDEPTARKRVSRAIGRLRETLVEDDAAPAPRSRQSRQSRQARQEQERQELQEENNDVDVD